MNDDSAAGPQDSSVTITGDLTDYGLYIAERLHADAIAASAKRPRNVVVLTTRYGEYTLANAQEVERLTAELARLRALAIAGLEEAKYDPDNGPHGVPNAVWRYGVGRHNDAIDAVIAQLREGGGDK